MRKLFYVPIEALTERYTESWYRNLFASFESSDFEAHLINGDPLSSTIEVGTFLDINSTVAYKASQIQQIATLFHNKQVQAGDVFFIGDLEFWGIEALRLMSQMNCVPIYIFGFMHAASYTREDAFAVAAPYQSYTEIGWLKSVDGVFVGSEYHKKAILERRVRPLVEDVQEQGRIADRILPTGNPMFSQDYAPSLTDAKKLQLVLPNRLDQEKRPDVSLSLAALLKEHFPALQVVVCTSRPTLRSNQTWLVEYARWLEKNGVITIRDGLTKAEYHTILAESAVMLTTSIEENFGYCVAEAMHYGTLPVMANAFSHPEFVSQQPWLAPLTLYSSYDDAFDKCAALITAYTNQQGIGCFATLQDLRSALKASVKRFFSVDQSMIGYMLDYIKASPHES